jgi:fido (protein-threonine AMPylation protein)
MALTGAHAPGTTPLTEEDIRGLELQSITTRGELNEAEAQNILRGQEWALRSRTRALSDMLSDEYLLRLHKRMFGDVAKRIPTPGRPRTIAILRHSLHSPGRTDHDASVW